MYALDPPPRIARFIKGVPAGSAGSCPAGICFWFNEGCTIGCPNCTGPGKLIFSPHGSCGAKQGKATLPDYARTQFYKDTPLKQPREKECGINPWCAPGSAPVESPCGLAGGDKRSGAAGAGGHPPAGSKQGDDASDLPELKGKKAIWKAGGTAEVSWAIIANHGGGYQFRLCPKQARPSEECFQKTPLEFEGNESYIQWVPPPKSGPYQLYSYPPPFGGLPTFDAPDPKNRTAIPRVTVNTGTIPAGSTWARNPIPHCKAGFGGALGLDGHCTNDPAGFQFPPAIEDRMRPGKLLGGFGGSTCYGTHPVVPGSCAGMNAKPPNFSKMWEHNFNFNIVDKVKVPKLPPGEYIMSARFDCEQTPQIWSTCSDITIVADEVLV